MIWHWMLRALRFVVWLFAPAQPRDVAKINANAPCPVCNHRNGNLRTVHLMRIVAGKPPIKEVFCRHECNNCGARFFELPVVEVNPNVVLPAVAADDWEKSEDLTYVKAIEGPVN
jgi:C4-type Zn-finger protein